MKIMLDLLVLALQTDKTRVVSLMLNNDLSGMNFSNLGGIQGGQHEIFASPKPAEKVGDVSEDQRVPHGNLVSRTAKNAGNAGRGEDVARKQSGPLLFELDGREHA